MLANSFSRGLNGFDIRVNEMVCIMWNWLRMFLAVRALLGRGYTDYIALVEFWVLFWVLYCLLQLEIRSSATVCSFWYMALSLSLITVVQVMQSRQSGRPMKLKSRGFFLSVKWMARTPPSSTITGYHSFSNFTLVQAIVFVLSLWSYNNFPLHTSHTPGSCMCHVERSLCTKVAGLLPRKCPYSDDKGFFFAKMYMNKNLLSWKYLILSFLWFCIYTKKKNLSLLLSINHKIIIRLFYERKL